MTSHASSLIRQHLDLMVSSATQGEVLDLACGRGRNGLYLVNRGFSVRFADRSREALDEVQAQLKASGKSARLWQVDFEEAEENPLSGKAFAAILVFNYLYRPLLEYIREAITPGGLVVYETFTVDNLRFGRPRNPDYLLRAGELAERFHDWDCMHYFEGEVEGSAGARAIAQIIARKPAD